MAGAITGETELRVWGIRVIKPSVWRLGVLFSWESFESAIRDRGLGAF
jgi:hypothetical protein